MTERRLSREAAQLRERLGPSVCAYPAPCQTTTISEVRIMPGGREMRTGAEPRPLCGGCPNREARAVRYVEVRLDYRNRHGGEIAASAATLPPVGPDGGEEERRASDTTDVPTTCDPEPDDGMPAAWGPDHPVRLSLKGREPPARRSRNGGVSSVRPEDFGLT